MERVEVIFDGRNKSKTLGLVMTDGLTLTFFPGGVIFPGAVRNAPVAVAAVCAFSVGFLLARAVYTYREPPGPAEPAFQQPRSPDIVATARWSEAESDCAKN